MGIKKNIKEADRVVIGIDPGTGRCGFAIINLKSQNANLKIKTLELVDCGVIETKANTPLDERLKIIFNKITELIKTYKPQEMAIEELFFVKNIKTGISVSHARGVIILAAKLANLEIFEYKPNSVKSAIVGFGHATKDQIQKMLKIHLKGCNITQDDAADAAAIALTHLQTVKR